MYTSTAVESIFVSAWERGFILQADFDALKQQTNDDSTRVLVSRLTYAIRRGHISLRDRSPSPDSRANL